MYLLLSMISALIFLVKAIRIWFCENVIYSFKQTSNRLAQPITNKDQDKFVFYKQEFKDLWESETANLELTV